MRKVDECDSKRKINAKAYEDKKRRSEKLYVQSPQAGEGEGKRGQQEKWQ